MTQPPLHFPNDDSLPRCVQPIPSKLWVTDRRLLDILMDLVHSPVEFSTHEEPELSNQDHDKHDGGEDRYEEDLEVELHQPDPGRPIKRLPGIEHRHGTATTKNLGLDFAGKGAVEGDDGVVFLGEHGSLDTLEGDVGRDGNENEDAEADETDEEHLQQRNVLRATHIHIPLLVVSLVAKEKENLWHVDRSLFGNSEDGGGNDDVPDSSPGWDPFEPALVARFGNDYVGPGHLKTAEHDACEDGDEGASDGVADDAGAEEADDGAVEELVDYRYVDTADTGKRASLCADVLDGGAQCRGDGLLLDEEEIGFDEFGLL